MNPFTRCLVLALLVSAPLAARPRIILPLPPPLPLLPRIEFREDCGRDEWRYYDHHRHPRPAWRTYERERPGHRDREYRDRGFRDREFRDRGFRDRGRGFHER